MPTVILGAVPDVKLAAVPEVFAALFGISALTRERNVGAILAPALGRPAKIVFFATVPKSLAARVGSMEFVKVGRSATTIALHETAPAEVPVPGPA